MRHTKAGLGVMAAVMLAGAAGVMAAAAEAATPAGEWKVVYERDLSQGDVFGEWIPVMGRWTITPDGLRKKGLEQDGLLMLTTPVVKGAVRIEYETKADERPADLSLFLGLKDGEFAGCPFFGFGSADNTLNKIRVPGFPEMTAQVPLVTPGRWHKVVVAREDGRLAMSVDGQEVASREDDPGGFPGPYIGLYAWNEGVFRHVKIEQRADATLGALLYEKTRKREAGYGTSPFQLIRLCHESHERSDRIEHLLRQEMPASQRLTSDRATVSMEKDLTPGWGTMARAANGELVAVFSAGREAEDDPFGRIQMIRSDTAGRDWSAPVTVADTPLGDREPGVIALKSGALLVTWRATPGLEDAALISKMDPKDVARWKAHVAGIPEADRTNCTGSWCAISTDNGRTWSEPVRTPVFSPHGPLQLNDGRVLYLGCGAVEGKPVLAAAESRDEGKTWSVIWKQALDNDELKGIRDAHAAALPDGRIVGVFQIDPKQWKYTGGLYYQNAIWQIESADGGRTWSPPRVTPMWGFPPHLAVLKDGNLVCTYGCQKDPFKGSQRVQPASQRVCLSYDSGRTWDIAHEITVRGDAPDQHKGYPTTVQADDGWLVTLYSQATVGGERPRLERTRWIAPPKLPDGRADDGLTVEMSEPVTVVAGPLKERRWGFYQFPGLNRTTNGDLVVSYQIADDTVAGMGASYPSTPFVSHDSGKTWVELTNTAATSLGFTLKDGTELRFEGFDKMGAAALGLKPFIRQYDGGYDMRMDIYRYADLPDARRVIRAARRSGGGEIERYAAPFDFPSLAMVVYKSAYNSEKKSVVIPPDDLYPGYFRLDNQYALELPDGTILAVTECTTGFTASGAPEMGTYILASIDKGRSWKHYSTVWDSDASRNARLSGENSLTRLPNGTLVCVMRTELGGNPEIPRILWLSISGDDGRTWSRPRWLNAFGVWPHLLPLANGITACIYGRPGVEVRFSKDPDGIVWSGPYSVRAKTEAPGQDTTCGYTGILPTGPDRFLVVYSDFYHRDAQWVLHKAIKVREIHVTKRAPQP